MAGLADIHSKDGLMEAITGETSKNDIHGRVILVPTNLIMGWMNYSH